MSRETLLIVASICILTFVILGFIITISVKRGSLNKYVIIPFSLIVVASIFITMFYTIFGYYDRYGNRYSNFLDVKYYSTDGSEYVLSDGYYGDTYFTNVSNPSDRHRDVNTYVNDGGFLEFDDSGIVFSQVKSSEYFISSQGEQVRSTKYLSWNIFGTICFN
jgi:hypothetical protein